RRPDEIGVLTEHYNRMVDRLAEKDEKLRELYAEARERADYLSGYSNHLVAGVPSGVVAIDTKGTVTVWNRSACHILRKEGKVGVPLSAQLGSWHPLLKAFQGALQGSITDQALIVLDDAGSTEAEDDEDLTRMVELTCAPFRG